MKHYVYSNSLLDHELQLTFLQRLKFLFVKKIHIRLIADK